MRKNSRVALLVAVTGSIFACMAVLAPPAEQTQAQQDPTTLYLQGRDQIRQGQQLIQQGQVIAAQTRSAISTATAEVRQTEAAIARQTAAAQAQATAAQLAINNATATGYANATATGYAQATGTRVMATATEQSARATGTAQMATATMDAILFAESIQRQNERVNVALRVVMTLGVIFLMLIGIGAWRVSRPVSKPAFKSAPQETQQVKEASLQPDDIEVDLNGEAELWKHLQEFGTPPAEVKDG